MKVSKLFSGVLALSAVTVWAASAGADPVHFTRAQAARDCVEDAWRVKGLDAFGLLLGMADKDGRTGFFYYLGQSGTILAFNLQPVNQRYSDRREFSANLRLRYPDGDQSYGTYLVPPIKEGHAFLQALPSLREESMEEVQGFDLDDESTTLEIANDLEKRAQQRVDVLAPSMQKKLGKVCTSFRAKAKRER